MRIFNVSKRKKSRGQALIETAMVLLLYVFLIIGCLGEAVHIVAQVEITNAVDLATISAAQAPLGDNAAAQTYFDNSFFYTIGQNSMLAYSVNGCTVQGYLQNGCSGHVPQFCADSGYLAGNHSNPVVSCQVTGIQIDYPKTALGLLYRADVTVPTVSDKVYPSQYRTCGGEVACS